MKEWVEDVRAIIEAGRERMEEFEATYNGTVRIVKR